MSLSVDTGPRLSTVETFVTSGRGLNPEEITALLMPRLLYVSDNAPPAIRAQAEAFRTNIERLVLHYVRQAQKSQNTTIYNVLMEAGEGRAAELVRKL